MVDVEVSQRKKKRLREKVKTKNACTVKEGVDEMKKLKGSLVWRVTETTDLNTCSLKTAADSEMKVRNELTRGLGQSNLYKKLGQ